MEQAEQNRLFESLGRIEANQKAMREELLGPGGRIVKLEADQERATKERWVHTAVVIPAFGAIHAILNLFGIRI